MAFIHRAVVLQCIYISIKRCVSFIFPSLLGTNYTIASSYNLITPACMKTCVAS